MTIDYELTEDQRSLVTSFREFLQRECPEDLVRKVEVEGTAYSPELWKKMAEVGIQGLGLPEKYGGSGTTFLEMGLFFEEAGRVLLPGPHLSTLAVAGQAILQLGTEEQRRYYLPSIAKGKTIVALALTEKEGEIKPEEMRLQAVPDGNQYRLRGAKYFIKDAKIATHFLVLARTNATVAPEYGLTLFLVDAKTPGITVRPFRVISGDLMSEVAFNDVATPTSSVLGGVNRGWFDVQPAIEKGKVALALQMAGAADALMWRTIEYMKERITFGRPLGTNQALQHRMADVAIAVYGARYQGYSVAWKLSQGIPCSDEVSLAKIAASNAYRVSTNEGVQMHGGYGLSMEFYPQLYWRRMRLDEVLLGDSFQEKELVSSAAGL